MPEELLKDMLATTHYAEVQGDRWDDDPDLAAGWWDTAASREDVDDEDVTPGGAPSTTALHTAQRAILESALARACRRVANSVRRAAAKPDKFLAALDGLEAAHAPPIAESLTLVLVAADLVGGRVTDAGRLARVLVQVARAELLALAGDCQPAGLAARVAAWCGVFEANTPAHLAGEVLAGPGPFEGAGRLLYDPDQPRDERGRFGGGGGGSAKGEAAEGRATLSPEAQGAVDRIGETARAGGDRAVSDTVAAWDGPKGPAAEKALKEGLTRAMAGAEITVNFDPARAGPGLAAAGKLLNGYDSGARSPGYLGARDKQEQTVLGAAGVPRGERPCYAAVNWEGNLYGAASQYGHGSIVLNQDAFAGKVTLAPRNTFGLRGGEHLGTLKDSHNAIARNEKALQAAGFPHKAGDVTNPGAYTEAHFWGDVPLNKDTVKEIRMPAEHAATPGATALVDFGARAGVPVKFFDGATGKPVSYEDARAKAQADARGNSWLGRFKSWLGVSS